ncbi:MAG: biotin/lipoyl-binding protein [Prolixibacteraceae bacterium]|jgi:biotin carboxyl carrier protein|nr:biotin/lipoyl-binding protein [Prolixibacteraceae bacterium]
MPLEVKTQNRKADVKLIDKKDTIYNVEVDGKQYEVDISKINDIAYSTIFNGRSVDVELSCNKTGHKYEVHTRSNDFAVEIIDDRTRYLEAAKDGPGIDEAVISSPMPGKIVRIDVEKQQEVKKGQTLIVVSAMKMESEYKSPVDGIIHRINVSQGDNINGGEPLIEVEPKNDK